MFTTKATVVNFIYTKVHPNNIYTNHTLNLNVALLGGNIAMTQ